MLVLITPFNSASAASESTTTNAYTSRTETFYGYKTASYSFSKITETYSSTWDGYYRTVYRFYYDVKTTGGINSSDLTNSLTNTYAKKGTAIKYCFPSGNYYMTRITSDIDFARVRGDTWDNYWQPQVGAFVNGIRIGTIQYESNSVNDNGVLNVNNMYIGGKCIEWRVESDNTNNGRNTTWAGGWFNTIDYYKISSNKYYTGWQWNSYKNTLTNKGYINVGQYKKGYLYPNWSSPIGWRSSKSYGNVKRGSTTETTASDQKSVTFTVTYDANGGSGTVTFNSGTANLATNGYTREGYVFDGWYTSASGGTKVTTVSQLNPTEGGSVKVYAHWKDATPPTIKDNSAITNACKANDGSVKWTNTNITGTFVIEDSGGLSQVVITNKAKNISNSYSPNGATKYEINYKAANNGEYVITATDKSGNSSSYSFTINCIDKNSPKMTSNLTCGALLSAGTSTVIGFDDDLSGVASWSYEYIWTDVDGNTKTFKKDCLATEKVDITKDFTSASSISLVIKAQDKAGNTYTNDNCTLNLYSQAVGDVVLTDYSQIVATYNSVKGDTNSFLQAITNLDTETSNAFLKIINGYKKENKSLSNEDAIAKFFNEYGLASQIS